MLTHQQNLLWSNGFLAVVDAIGIYRWLGHRAKLEDGAKAAASKSEVTSTPLFSVLSLEGLPIKGSDGSVMAHVVGGMAECESGPLFLPGGSTWRGGRREIASHDPLGRSPGG